MTDGGANRSEYETSGVNFRFEQLEERSMDWVCPMWIESRPSAAYHPIIIYKSKASIKHLRLKNERTRTTVSSNIRNRTWDAAAVPSF